MLKNQGFFDSFIEVEKGVKFGNIFDYRDTLVLALVSAKCRAVAGKPARQGGGLAVALAIA